MIYSKNPNNEIIILDERSKWYKLSSIAGRIRKEQESNRLSNRYNEQKMQSADYAYESYVN